jgi:hypothetical protein
MKSCCKKLSRDFRKATMEQAMVHQREITAIALELTLAQEALRDSLSMLSAARRGMWTPADDVRLAEILKSPA